MLLKAPLIDDTYIRIPSLPNLASKSQFLVSPKRKATLDQLHRFLKRQITGNGHQDVNVIWHDDKFVYSDSSRPHLGSKNFNEKL